MRSFRLLLALLFALVATSFASPDVDVTDIEIPELETRKDRNNTGPHGGNTAQKACKEMRKLERITKLASNQTKLDELVAKGKLTTAKVDQLKAKAADAQPKLQAMSTNSTLTTECAKIAAENKMKEACKKMKRLQRMADIVKNQTALDAFATRHKLNSTRVDKLKAKVQKDQAKLTELQSNTTLTAFCSQQKSAGNNAGGNGSGSGTTQAGTTTPNSATTGGRPQQVTTNGASGTHMTPATLSYIFASMIAGVFVMLL